MGLMPDLGRSYTCVVALILSGMALAGFASEKAVMDSKTLNEVATRYTAAWCSQHAASVASFFEEQGSLKINDGTPAVGRAAITNSAQSFMTAFPDIVVKMDRLVLEGTKIEYHWTLTGTNTGQGVTGKFVKISGFEEWRFGPDGLIAESLGHFDAADYKRQLDVGGQRP
jgi:predicted ester cyclase